MCAGVRKHCRKSHAEWLREVDLEKASLGCRWAAYCTRVVLEEGRDEGVAQRAAEEVPARAASAVVHTHRAPVERVARHLAT